ncbi:MAG: carbamoyl-phosphate synthase (glutamine-hydrolyzing) large subunit [Calditrichaeota bacterium]|nr:MAG: carbamoyl-phosphate synthase (glutamine-hydrolyzing) large subunit [Calditrichota bacterium]MBL1206950.1 carbamoyl-phosphate synthase (glutamine-hydrolyzing) large subunit [Calditrichota bacterium]NOG46777.1 carbamoyl-phosphate synthase (glutamine-hydrolyzing) large subunit [Calditrichota bacterium]
MNSEIKKVLILGSAALKIGEAGEFDYSGSQAIKALKEEGVKTVLINPNIATIQTSEHLADKVYFLPVNVEFVEKIIKKEKPDGILLSFGGQTALNTGLELHEKGILKENNVRVLGTPVQTILETEDRDLFVKRLNEVEIKSARSAVATSDEEAKKIANEIGYPVMVRIAFALGGLGSGICRDEKALLEKCHMAFNHTSQILIEEYLLGWKEVEYEVVRDKYDNCVTVCNMENFDPMGIHTGESIVVAPSQTLSNRDYHLLREVAIKAIKHLGIVGECNIQYAYNPHTEDYRVIEVNARLSRSSALASKATGYPLAFVAAKLALGYGLFELTNAVTKTTNAFFEPALDYVIVKMPRWDLRKFKKVSYRIGSSMKSVGEVMAIGRNFEEALQKAIRMLETGPVGFAGNDEIKFDDHLDDEISQPTDFRLFAIANALRKGYTVEKIHELSHINKWFLHKLANIIQIENELIAEDVKNYEHNFLLKAKQFGFSDKQIAKIKDCDEKIVRDKRHKLNIHPFLRQIDTLAAEYPAQTNYLYLTYNAIENDVQKHDGETVLILGSGAYRIGSSVEFDWCAVNGGRSLREMGYNTIMLNYNPETVSTDYDEFDMLIFDEINLEAVIEVFHLLSPAGTIISMGGQVPNNLAVSLDENNIPVLGTSPKSIDMAENRRKFSDLLDSLSIDQPVWQELSSVDQAFKFAKEAGYPVLVRPSYVLSGAAMAVASNPDELENFLQKAVEISPDHPTVISKFYENAKEIEFDAVAKDGNIMAYAISEHVENAGVHSGDATLVFPPQRTYLETMRRIRLIAKKIAGELKITGPFNMQVLAKNNQVKVIECNVRASRSFPFVSKIIKKNFIGLATRAIMKDNVERMDSSFFEFDYVGVKAPQFSFTRLEGADPVSGVEMASTGEVGCLGEDFHEAYLKSLISVGYRFPIKSILVSSGTIESKAELLESMRIFRDLGVQFFATGGTAKFMSANGFDVQLLHWPLEDKKPNAIDYIKGGLIDMVINIPKNYQKDELTNGYHIRRAAADFNTMLITNRQLVMRLAEALAKYDSHDLQIKSWNEYSH